MTQHRLRVALSVNHHSPQPVLGDPALPVALSDQPALARVHLHRKFPAVLARYHPACEIGLGGDLSRWPSKARKKRSKSYTRCLADLVVHRMCESKGCSSNRREDSMSRELGRKLTRVEFAQSEPLTTRLHGLIRSYPRGVGLIQEFVQNADDAGATAVSVWMDSRSYPSTSLPAPTMSALQGPAIVVMNNACFTDQDWRRLQTIGQSGKSLDSSKTGRFGLGFNSVYNVTDHPCILSGDTIGIFDPHGSTVAGASLQHPGGAWRLDDVLWEDAADLLAPFLDHGLSARATRLDATVFRLPLRTPVQAAVSKICSEAFNCEDFDSIVDKLGDRVGELMLFLNNVTRLEFGVVEATGERRIVLSAHTTNDSDVTLARGAVHDILRQDHASLLASLRSDGAERHRTYRHEMELLVLGAASHETWAVTRGIFVDSGKALLDCAEEMYRLEEKAVPVAGAASLAGSSSSKMVKGRVFCGLPLPLVSPTGECHVDGFFDLQADRQGLFEDREAEGGGAARVRWNEALIEHGCARAMAIHCAYLAHEAVALESMPYQAWPRVPAETRDLLDRLPMWTYDQLRAHECIATGHGRRWRAPGDVLVLPQNAEDQLYEPLLADDLALPQPRLPGWVIHGFSTCGHPLRVLTAKRLRDVLRVESDCEFAVADAPRECLRKREWILALLNHCASDGKLADLVGVPLGLLANGRVRSFSKTRAQKHYLAGQHEREIFALQPHWFLDIEAQDSCGLAVSVEAGLLEFTPQIVLINLHNVLPKLGDAAFINPAEHDDAPTAEWLESAFRYLAERHKDVQLQANVIRSIPLVPDQFGMLRGMGSADTPLLASSDDQTRLGDCLQYFKVPIVAGGSGVMSAIRAFVDAFPGQAIWRVDPVDLIDTLDAVDGPQNSDEKTIEYSHSRHGVLLDYLASRGVAPLKGKAQDRVEKLRGLRLFPTASGEVVSLKSGDYYVPDSYTLPTIETDVGLLQPGPKEQWNPLYRTIGVPTLTRARLITELLLPRISQLAEADVMQLALWLRQNLQAIRESEESDVAEALVERLGSELPIMCTDKACRTADALYHPDAEFVGGLLGASVGFPDLAIYSDRSGLWLEFFETLGMARTPRADHIVSAIDQLLQDECESSEKTKRLGDIAHYLEGHWETLEDEDVLDDELRPEGAESWHLSDALSHRAWLPVLREVPRGVPEGMLAEWEEEFFPPGDLFTRSSFNVVGSVQPVCALDGISRLGGSIGIQSEPELSNVVEQLVNICEHGELSEDRTVSGRLANMMRSIYRHLGHSMAACSDEQIESSGEVTSLRERLSALRCVLDESQRPWRPEQCFEDPVSFLCGHGVRVRAEDRELDRGLQVLGRRRTPEVDDFRRLFNALLADTSSRAGSLPDHGLLRQAYRMAAAASEPGELIDAPVLSAQGTLVRPTEMVLDDAPWLSERIRAAGVYTLDASLDRAVAIAFGVRLVSTSLYERPQREHLSQCAAFLNRCKELEERLRSPELLRGVQRLMVAAGTVVRREQLSGFFREIGVKGVKELETTLVWLDEDVPVEGSVGLSDVLFDPGQNTLIVSEDAEEVLVDLIGDVISRELQLDGHTLGEMTAKLVAMLRVPPARMERHLTKLHVPMLPDDLRGTDDGIEDEGGLIDYVGLEGDEGDLGIDADYREEHEKDESDGPVSEGRDDRHAIQARTGGRPGVREGSSRPETAEDSSESTTHRVEDSGPTESDATDEDEGAGELSDSGHDSSIDGISSSSGGEGLERGSSEPASNARKAVEQTHELPATSEGRRRRSRGRRAESGDAGEEKPASGASRSNQASSGRGWIAVTRVKPQQDGDAEESPARQENRRRVDQGAVKRVVAFEAERGRRAMVMQHENEGYDIESVNAEGRVERYIEVKGLSGAWTDFGVAVSRAQHRRAARERAKFWLYVVEFALEPDRSRVFAIQDPEELIDQYRFDDGWKILSKEQDGPGTGVAPREGAGVLVDGTRQGRIKGIQSHGALKHLQIEFADGQVESLVYTPRRVTVVDDE